MRKDAAGRVVSDNVFGEMWEDAARRDFTINAMYYDPATEELYDYHHGFEDIAAKRVRMIGDPAARYREDPVRMLRAIRISAKLGFKMDPATERPIAKMGALLKNVPSARLSDELLKILTCGQAVESMKKLREAKLNQALMPILDLILSEPDGEKFLMLALRRTDERLAVGKRSRRRFFLEPCCGRRLPSAGLTTKRSGNWGGSPRCMKPLLMCWKRSVSSFRFNGGIRRTCTIFGSCRPGLSGAPERRPGALFSIRATVPAMTSWCFAP